MRRNRSAKDGNLKIADRDGDRASRASTDLLEILGRCQQVRLDARSAWLMAHQAIDEAHKMHKMLQPQIQELAATPGFRLRYRNGLLAEILRAAALNTGATMGNIQIVQPDACHLAIQVQFGFRPSFLEYFDRVESGHAACGMALRKQKRQFVEDVTSSDIFQGSSLEVLLDAGVRSVQSTPLSGRSGNVVGILSTHYGAPRHFRADEFDVIDRYARSAARIIEWFNKQQPAQAVRHS